MFCLWVYLCAICIPNTYEGQGVLGFREPELHTVMSHHVDVENLHVSYGQEASALNCGKIFPPQVFIFIFLTFLSFSYKGLFYVFLLFSLTLFPIL